MKAKQLAERSQKDPAVERQIAGDHRAREGLRAVAREADRELELASAAPRRDEEGTGSSSSASEAGTDTSKTRSIPRRLAAWADRNRRRPHMGTAKDNQSFRLPILGEDVASALGGDIDIDAELRKLDEAAALGARPGGAVQDDRLTLVRPDGQPAVHEEPAREDHAAGLGPDRGARLPGQGRAHRPRLQGRGHRRARQRRPALRQGVRQPRPVQPDLLHRRQPGQVPDRAGPSRTSSAARHGREVRLPDRGRVRPLPLRHVRDRVPQGAARRGLRRLPRDAVPAEGRPEAGDRRGSGPGDEPRLLHRAR